MAKKSKPPSSKRRMLQAQAAPALAPPSTDIDMANTGTPLDQMHVTNLDVGSQAVDQGAHVSISKLSLGCSLGRFQVLKVNHQDIQFGLKRNSGPLWALLFLGRVMRAPRGCWFFPSKHWVDISRLSLGTTLTLGIAASYQFTSGIQSTLPLSCVLGFGIAPAYLVGPVQMVNWVALGLESRVQWLWCQRIQSETTIAESNTTRELSDIKRRLDKHREDIDETHAMVTYTGNAQFTFEAMIEKFDDRLEDAAKREEEHRLNCNRELLKMYCSLDDMSSSGPTKVARDVRQNKAQEEMRKANQALISENARLKGQVKKQDAAIEQLTSTVNDMMGRFAKLESTVHCTEAERKLSELEV
ncbi:uncharacterized protein FMAN_11243 [Fusarium mangiferae]|uniref:Uncharacterized protein n=1 Tax=Fusarium mangiferae TaxID=192010 RepID=A0A1L7TMT3_FUSMA|nr:uncharacterized protein FMAN_11243 [Fusarium mangiferae]CVK96975.1 uncharacterized protein FMAN_11243 [Fusarium mangiferae]